MITSRTKNILLSHPFTLLLIAFQYKYLIRNVQTCHVSILLPQRGGIHHKTPKLYLRLPCSTDLPRYIRATQCETLLSNQCRTCEHNVRPEKAAVRYYSTPVFDLQFNMQTFHLTRHSCRTYQCMGLLLLVLECTTYLRNGDLCS